MSLNAGKARTLFGASRARAVPAVAAAALALAACGSSPGMAQLARVNFQPLPSSIVTLSAAQIARIKD